VAPAGEALEHHPGNVLSLRNTEIVLDDICSGPDVDDPRFGSFSRSLVAILRGQQMLRTIHEPNLIQLRCSYLSHLCQAKLSVADFYGHKECHPLEPRAHIDAAIRKYSQPGAGSNGHDMPSRWNEVMCHPESSWTSRTVQ